MRLNPIAYLPQLLERTVVVGKRRSACFSPLVNKSSGRFAAVIYELPLAGNWPTVDRYSQIPVSTQSSGSRASASEQLQSGLMIRCRVARLLELLPVRRVLERLFVLCGCLLRLALPRQHVSPRFQRIRPVGATMIRVFELRGRAVEVSVLRKRQSPRVVACWQIGRECHRLGIPFLGIFPVAATIEDVTAESIAIDERAARIQNRIRFVRMARRFFSQRHPAVITGPYPRYRWIRIGVQELSNDTISEIRDKNVQSLCRI
jgi:hypothetical protein